MIYTLTLNPSLDYTVRLAGFRRGALNRAEDETIRAGGKGINVSLTLGILGCDSVALGFAAGFTGREIARRVSLAGCRADFIEIPGESRINVKLKDGEETEINGRGPEADSAALAALEARLEALRAGDFLVLSGSLARGMPRDYYARVAARQGERGVRVVVDAEGEALRLALVSRPFLVKPNQSELEALFEQPIGSRAAALPFAERLREAGAQNVLVSLGAEGAVLAASDGTCRESPAPQGRPVDTVGAGDAMVAGFLAGWLRSGGDAGEALRLAVAVGSAKAFAEGLPPAQLFVGEQH